MHNYFYALYAFISRKRFLSAIIALITIGVLAFFASRITFQENINQLIPSNQDADITNKVLGQVNFADKISVLITRPENASESEMSEYANRFLDSINTSSSPYIQKIQGRLDEENLQETFDFVYNNLPLFLDESDYRQIESKIQRDSIASIIDQSYKGLVSPTGLISRDFILKDPLGISFIALKKLQQLSIGDDFELLDGFVVTKDQKNLLLFITPSMPANETDKNTVFINNLERIRTGLNAEFKGKAQMTYFGATPVAVANASQIKADVHNTSLFAVITLVLLLVYFYRSVSIPFIIFIPSIFGYAFALALLYFMKGSISVIALGISSILLGETTDYSIYVLTHIRNNRNIKLLYKDISKPLILCGVTTAITFLCLFFVKSEALKDLALFAAFSVIATSVFSLVLIPMLYRPKKVAAAIPTPNVVDKLGSYPYQKNKILIASVLILTALSFFTYSRVGFNNDLSALNYVPANLRDAESKLETIANGSSRSIYLATYGNTYEQALAGNSELFSKLGSEKNQKRILNFSSIGGIVTSEQDQKQKIDKWNSFWQPKKADLIDAMISNGSKAGFKEESFRQFYETLDKKFMTVPVSEFMKVKALFLDEFISEKDGFYTISSLVKVSAANRDSFVAEIKKQQDVVVIDRKETNETFLGTLKNNFADLVNYSFIAIFLILFLSFRRVELVIVSIIPILFSWIFTIGIMGLFGLQFNIINIIVCTLIFGIGVDYSIFMTSALQKEHTFGSVELPTYRTSILLSVATTILGIGVLIFAKHPALRSISIIALIGIFSTVVVTFVVQPLIFAFFVTNRVKKALPPFEIRKLIHSSLSFFYYGFGGFLLSIVSVTMMKILPISRKSKVRAFHYLTSKFMHSVLISYPSCRRNLINTPNEKFDKPAVIIANHSSFLDILAVGMLSPKIIFLVSDWVYNSPIFGKGVRLAGFYPVSSGIDNGIEHLREKVEQGFSLMVFPEGTRSEDNTIKRFHKGAFFLAEQFKLDIVPVVIHGYSEILPKGDFIINGFQTTLEILPRITPDDNKFGIDYTDKTKKAAAFFKSHHKKMRLELEGPNYFKKLVLNSFAYKESEIITEVKNSLSQNLPVFHALRNQIGENAKIFHIADDYGQTDILLAIQQPRRKIVSFIAEPEKRSVARTNYILKKRNITYLDELNQTALLQSDILLVTAKFDITRIPDVVSFSGTIIFVGETHVTIDNFISKNEQGFTILKKEV